MDVWCLQCGNKGSVGICWATYLWLLSSDLPNVGCTSSASPKGTASADAHSGLPQCSTARSKPSFSLSVLPTPTIHPPPLLGTCSYFCASLERQNQGACTSAEAATAELSACCCFRESRRKGNGGNWGNRGRMGWKHMEKISEEGTLRLYIFFVVVVQGWEISTVWVVSIAGVMGSQTCLWVTLESKILGISLKEPFLPLSWGKGALSRRKKHPGAGKSAGKY